MLIPAVGRWYASAQGGGLTAERRQSRERIRCEAGERFARGEKTAVIAKVLRVSERSVERWRRAWREGGMDALASTGPAKLPKLSDGQFAELEKELARTRRARLGRPMVDRGADQSSDRLEVPDRLLDGDRVAAVAPARLVLAESRALERDEHAVELWKKDVWPQVE
jgi:Homeodomain-like domain-containing protein